MSSHHVVKEKQEPALLILSLDGFDLDHLGQLLEWSPTVFVSGAAYGYVESLGIKIDGVVGEDPDLVLQANARRVISQGDSLSDGIHYFVEHKYPALNIIADDFAYQNYEPYVHQIDLVIYVKTRKIFPVRTGFAKWKAKGETVELLQPVGSLSVTNLRAVSATRFLVEMDGFYKLYFEQPSIFVGEEI